MTLTLGMLTMNYLGDGQGGFQVGSRWLDGTGIQEKGWAKITGMA